MGANFSVSYVTCPQMFASLLQITFMNSQQVRVLSKWGDTNTNRAGTSCPLRHFFIPLSLYAFVFIQCFNDAVSASTVRKVNVTLPLCLNSDHVIGSGIWSHAFLNMAQETGGQLHAPAILASDTELPLPTVRVRGWTPKQIWTLLSKKTISCLCRECNPVSQSSRP
jgi:hypothetical protein